VPAWIGMWALVAAITAPWRGVLLYENGWTWIPAGTLFCAGLILYKLSHREFSLIQLGGLPEILYQHSRQRLVTTGIRARIRHPVYLGHLCEMLEQVQRRVPPVSSHGARSSAKNKDMSGSICAATPAPRPRRRHSAF